MALRPRPSALLWGLLLALGAALVHALFPHLPPWLQWFLSGFTLYSVLRMMGLSTTLRQRPHQIDGAPVCLHPGPLASLQPRKDRILSVGPCRCSAMTGPGGTT